MSLDRCHNIERLRAKAKRRLPAPIFHYLDGGADDEVTLRRNTDAFNDYELVPNLLRDTSNIDTKTKALGVELDWPVFLSPTGMSKLFHHTGERAAARAAHKAGTLYSLSTMATTTIEDVAAETPGPKMFQIYVYKDRGLTKEFIARCKAAKYDAICVTIDVPVPGNRERDLVTGMTMPPTFSLASLFSFATHPVWSLNALRNPSFDLVNMSQHESLSLKDKQISPVQYLASQIDSGMTWKDAEWMAQEWGGRFLIKGVHSAHDAKKAVEIGAHGVMVSNHGGRQLDGVQACIDALPPIVDAVGGELDIILDGGIRRGTHVIKALALGATACSIGRSYVYGLGAGGQAGVEKALHILRSEIERSMALLGVTKISEITREMVVRRGT
ncbi:MAG: alpha-hydroxy-acid oxidizing protein [Rhodospirillaceae bacterium]|jgi:L-lactate dehydrogenase (cytochrome)|nr:alpha-hydroxy-acid oxidizing protein [Rhodospirillaceae bacterium]MBT5566383.1 alpha-hydroxy-acid oxidizing protein [Rhodospirillaceae bacterium]MBT6088476.1 alpha-hydroxy-acid oxidizing protein [Rhodospirillaceae bacterium]MBT6962084.1 alpha-hydroxy-acid oxidizing protein [Rhodospirillaceae bacterium]